VIRKQVVVWTIIGVVAVATATFLVVRLHRWRPGMMTIQGAVIRRDDDTRKELPISDALVTVTDGATSASAHSDASGYFKIVFPEVVWPGRSVVLSVEHAGYQSLDIKLETGPRLASRQLYVAAMTPIPQKAAEKLDRPLSVVSNIRVRYTVNSQTDENIGSAVKIFQVINQGNAACKKQAPCSPDGKWKATTGAATLDAGVGNEFRNVRASCIAGPCPFTRIDSSGFIQGGRTITASALDWSDTATFLLEAEVFHAAIRSNLRRSYPVIFGQALNFTLPPTQEGVSIEAELDGTPMVFPLGPDLYLSWATCTARTNTVEREKTTVYRCELKPGYRF